MTSKADASVAWARIDGNDSSLTEVTIGDDANPSDRFDWEKVIDALKGNTHVTTVIVHVDNLSTPELISLGFMLVSSGAIKTLQLCDCDSPEKLLALLKFFVESETLAVTCIIFDKDSVGALNTQDVAIETKKVLSNNRHLRNFRLILYGHRVKIKSFKTICQGVQASRVNDLNLGSLSTKRVKYCRSLIQDGILEKFAVTVEHDKALRLFGATIRGNSTLQQLHIFFIKRVSSESIREFLEVDLVTMKKLRVLGANVEGHTNRRIFGALNAAVSGLEAIKDLYLFTDRLDQNVFSALVPSFSHLSIFFIMADHRTNMQVNQGDDSLVDMLYDAFANNSSLLQLALPLGIFPPGTFSGLARAVPTMKSLKSLCLYDNNDTKIANNQTNSILNMVKRSNTLSYINCVYDDEVPESTKTEIEFHLKLNKVRHEDFVREAPLALWPRALAKIQKPQYKPVSLDVFYFLLRQRCDVLVPPGNSHKKRTVGEIE